MCGILLWLQQHYLSREPTENMNMSISSSSASEMNMDTSEQGSTGPRHVTFEDQVRDGNTSFDLPGVSYLPDPADQHKEDLQHNPSASIEDGQDNIIDSIKVTKVCGRVPVSFKPPCDVINQPGAGPSNTGQPTDRPTIYNDLTLSETDDDDKTSRDDKEKEGGDPEGQGGNRGAQH